MIRRPSLRRDFVTGALFGAGLIALLGLAALTLPVPGAFGCDGPLMLTAHGPEAAISRFIEDTGGLPRGDWSLISNESPTAPVASWSVQQVRVRNHQPTWFALLDDDPTYGVEADIAVDFADGTTATLHWSSWRYGLALCPVVIGMGDGPPGEFRARSVTAAP